MNDEKTVNYRLRDALASTAAWIVLVVFTTATAALNVWAAIIGKQNVWLHGLVPLIVLAAALFVEMVALSSVGKWTKASVITLAGFVFATVLGLSYVGVLRVLEAEYRPAVGSAEQYLVYGGAAVPDALMIAASIALVGLRVCAVRRGDVVKDAKKRVQRSRWSRLADAATNRIEARLEAPESPQVEAPVEVHRAAVEAAIPSVEPVVEVSVEVPVPSAETSTSTAVEAPRASVEPSVEPVAEVRAPSVETTTKPAVEVVKPELAPFMECAAHIVESKIVTRKSAIELAEVIAALNRGDAPNRIKTELGIAPGTTEKVAAAWARWQQEHRALTAVG